MAEVRIKFPKLTATQALIAASTARLNVIAGAVDSGKTTLAIDILLASSYGAMRGFPVAMLLPDEEAVEVAKRRIYALVQPLIDPTSRLDRNHIRMRGNRGSVTLVAMDKPFQLWDQIALVVIDDAVRIEKLLALWEDAIAPLLQQRRGRAFIFGKPRGVFNDFAKLAEYAAQQSDGELFHMATSENPHADFEALERDCVNMDPEVFKQERLGLFVQHSVEVTAEQAIIGRGETFRQWCMRLADDGMKVDDMPFKLDNRPAMWFIYDLIPSTVEEALERFVAMMKCTQVGFTVMEMLAMIYMAIKFMPAKIGMYLPNKDLAGIKSSVRFMPIVRTVPDAYRLLVDGSGGSGEGNVLVRLMGSSRFHFMWTSGKGATESIPLDILSLDEVQEMTKEQIEKTRERLSASRLKFILAGSTANWPDEDIDWLYKKGTRHQFWTRCPSCGEHHVLVSYFPECVGYDEGSRSYRYVCKSCKGWIDDAQQGEWRAQFGTRSWVELTTSDGVVIEVERWVDEEGNVIPETVHYPQFLSPTISAREIIQKYYNADDMKNFWNRVLGMPYTDPSQVPVNLEMLNACAALGMQMGVQWETRGSGYYMGIDQMGGYNVVLIAKRLPTGHMAIVHAEEILTKPTPEDPEASPFDRCDVLMKQYGIAVCVLETLPNYNDAKRFANRHPGKVFLAGYMAGSGDRQSDMLLWGDTPKQSSTDRRTDSEERDDYTVNLDQYKVMQVAMKRIQTKTTVFPDPAALVQEVYEKGTKGALVRMPILKDRVFFHFTRTALVAEKDEEQKKYRRKVVKVGIDPHFSYAYMLLVVAWSRAHGTSTFIFADESSREVVEMNGAKITSPVVEAIADQREMVVQMGTCGACESFDRDASFCTERSFRVRASDVACPIFLQRDDD
jgi:hypothetical protein